MNCALAVLNTVEGADDALTHLLGNAPLTIDLSTVFTVTTNSVAVVCPITYSFSVLDSVGAATTDLDTFTEMIDSVLSLEGAFTDML
jgi:hypothetical protein